MLMAADYIRERCRGITLGEPLDKRLKGSHDVEIKMQFHITNSEWGRGNGKQT